MNLGMSQLLSIVLGSSMGPFNLKTPDFTFGEIFLNYFLVITPSLDPVGFSFANLIFQILEPLELSSNLLYFPIFHLSILLLFFPPRVFPNIHLTLLLNFSFLLSLFLISESSF